MKRMRLWRQRAKRASFCVPNGLVVTADDVIMYGLAVEHTEQDLVQWSGERGRTYFYQSEVSPNQCLADSAFQL